MIFKNNIFKIIQNVVMPRYNFAARSEYLQPKNLKSLNDSVLGFKKKELPYFQKDLKKIDKNDQIIIKENYKGGFTNQDLEGASEQVKNVFKLENATPSEILSFKKQKSIEKFKTRENDSGNAACQVVALTEKMYHLISHCEKNRKDKITSSYLSKMIDIRRKILWHLRLTDFHNYMRVIQEFNIPDVPPKYHHHKQNLRGPRYSIEEQYSGHSQRYDYRFLKKSRRVFKK